MAGDQHEVYISLATFDTDYLRYIHNELGDDEPISLMKITDYGPFALSSKDGIEAVCQSLLALMLYFEEEQEGVAPGIICQREV